MQTQFILVWPLPVPTSSSQATHLRFSTISVNPLQTLNTPWDPSPLSSKILQETTRLFITILAIQETTSLLITTNFLREHKYFSFLEWIIKIEVPRGIYLF